MHGRALHVNAAPDCSTLCSQTKGKYGDLRGRDSSSAPQVRESHACCMGLEKVFKWHKARKHTTMLIENGHRSQLWDYDWIKDAVRAGELVEVVTSYCRWGCLHQKDTRLVMSPALAEVWPPKGTRLLCRGTTVADVAAGASIARGERWSHMCASPVRCIVRR